MGLMETIGTLGGLAELVLADRARRVNDEPRNAMRREIAEAKGDEFEPSLEEDQFGPLMLDQVAKLEAELEWIAPRSLAGKAWELETLEAVARAGRRARQMLKRERLEAEERGQHRLPPPDPLVAREATTKPE